MDGEPELGMRFDAAGVQALGPAGDGKSVRVVLTERGVEHIGDPSIGDLRDALVAVYGSDFGLRRANWISRFTDMARQAASYRRGRVLLAGDAAHVHPPQGGQGLNTGVQDAVNLGWKLAQVVDTTSPESLLDSYHAERHPVGARVLHNTMAQVALARGDDRHQALRDMMTELLSMHEPRTHIAAMLSGLDIRYDLGEGHPLLGRRMPDLDLRHPQRPAAGLHPAARRPAACCSISVNRAASTSLRGPIVSGWSTPRTTGVWELPVVGEVAAPAAVLIRPDGHVAWAGDLTDPALPRALATWFGAGRPGSSPPASERDHARS